MLETQLKVMTNMLAPQCISLDVMPEPRRQLGVEVCVRVCRCHYTGKLASNGAVFDSSYGRRPLQFKVCTEDLPHTPGACSALQHEA